MQVMGLNPRTVTFENEDARIIFETGWELRVALDKDLGATLFNLEAVLIENNLREKLESVRYIDMRFDERVYYTSSETTDSTE